jgi:Outer membrane protein beta-barrel domain
MTIVQTCAAQQSNGANMNKFALAVLLSAFVSAQAVAAEYKGNVGASFSTTSVIGIQGELDISSRANNAPVSVQAFWKYQQHDQHNAWDTSAIGVAGIYDFSSMVKMDKKAHPYAGAGLMSVSDTWTGTGAPPAYNGISSGLYVTAGLRYFFTPQLAADINFNNFGDLTAGVNLSF